VLLVSAATASRSALVRLDLAEALVDLVVPLLAVGTLAVLLGRPQPARDATPTPPALEEPVVAPPEESQPDPELQPTWQPDTAAGAAWYTAGDAASGRPAAGWGSPASASGWQPAPRLPVTAGDPAEEGSAADRPGSTERPEWGP
jgi:hypothetical protein